MRIFLTTAVSVVALALGAEAIEWPRDEIAASILRDDQYLKIGQYLEIQRNLAEGEFGWTMMKIDLPEPWTVESTEILPAGFALRLHGGRVFEVRSKDIGVLSFEILDGGTKSDAQLERIWKAYEKKG